MALRIFVELDGPRDPTAAPKVELMGPTLNSLLKIFGRKPRYRVITRRPTHRVVFPETLPFALQQCIAPEIAKGMPGANSRTCSVRPMA